MAVIAVVQKGEVMCVLGRAEASEIAEISASKMKEGL
jgi:hypothetical protein